MTTYTAEQVEAAIERATEDGDDWAYEAEYWVPANTSLNWAGKPVTHPDKRFAIDIEGVQEYVEFIDGKLPAEGGGEEVWLVVKVGTQFFEKAGCYTSHLGTDWDGELYEVRPVEKVVTVFEAI